MRVQRSLNTTAVLLQDNKVPLSIGLSFIMTCAARPYVWSVDRPGGYSTVRTQHARLYGRGARRSILFAGRNVESSHLPPQLFHLATKVRQASTRIEMLHHGEDHLAAPGNVQYPIAFQMYHMKLCCEFDL